MEDFACDLVRTVSENKDAIDEVISKLSFHWKLYRIDRVDRNILRMAIAEMVGFPEIPGRVTINEAVDLGKKFGTENSSAFINGILDRIHSISFGPVPEVALTEIIKRLDEQATTD
jgi:N utilization substance protein B